MTPPTPQTPHHTYLSRDERLQAQTLRLAGHSYADISRIMGFTQRQVQHACQSDRPTPKKRIGRPNFLTEEQVQELIYYISHSRSTRIMTYLQLAVGPFSHWSVSHNTIRYALRKKGYKRYIARAKPPLSEENKQRRYNWASSHVDWTQEQWDSILWTDETWVTGGRHTRVWVTRCKGEELNETCIIDKIQRRNGWMFWASFSGSTKGPSVFWEKEWGMINKESYCERIVPLIHGWITLHPRLQLMQDGAPGHSAGVTQLEPQERGVSVIYWPPYSPDLNPIETVWNTMKEYIAWKWGDKKFTHDQLRPMVTEAWNEVSSDHLKNLTSMEEMKARCQAVLDKNGGHTKY
jgi:hypothetical protein